MGPSYNRPLMTTDEQTYLWAMYRGLRFYLSFYRRDRERFMAKSWMLAHPRPKHGYLCWLCHRSIHEATGDWSLSFDHVIPQDLTIVYALPSSLLFDLRNIQPAHRRCNSGRGNKVPTYSMIESIPDRTRWLINHYQVLRANMRRSELAEYANRDLERIDRNSLTS